MKKSLITAARISLFLCVHLYCIFISRGRSYVSAAFDLSGGGFFGKENHNANNYDQQLNIRI